MFCGSRHFLSICCCLPALCTHAVKRNEWFSKCFRVSKMSSSATSFCTSPKKIMLRFKKLTDHATAPSKGSPFAAGYDLYSAYDYVIPASGKELVKTDLQICVPADTYGRIAPRSGLAHKNFIDVGAGVVDHDYRGNVGVILFNFGKADFIVKKGDRVAQLICERIHYPELEEVKELDDTDRGENGFGSTGTK